MTGTPEALHDCRRVRLDRGTKSAEFRRFEPQRLIGTAVTGYDAYWGAKWVEKM